MAVENKACPACHESSVHFLDWQYSGLDDSVLNYTAQLYHCDTCGLVYVDNIDDERLSLFYVGECLYVESAFFDISSPENIAKYSCYRDVLSEHGLANIPVTDVGCGSGGFLLWLNEQGWQADCLGIDIDTKSLPTAEHQKTDGEYAVRFQSGGALSLPFVDESQQLLTYFHVFEHIRDIDAVVSNAHRILMPDGHLLIEVPDAEHYANQSVGSIYCVGIREHVYHFSAQALIAALNRHGFEVISVRRGMLPMSELNYPSLMVLAKKGGDGNSVPEYLHGNDIAEFALSSQQALLKQAEKVRLLAQQHSALTLWGASNALFSLLPLLGGLDFALCDASEQKQQSFYQGYPVCDPAQVKPDGVLVITPYLYANSIERAALSMGWPQHLIYKIT